MGGGLICCGVRGVLEDECGWVRNGACIDWCVTVGRWVLWWCGAGRDAGRDEIK